MTYFYRHWTGQHSLARSFFINLLFPAVALYYIDEALNLALDIVPDTALVLQFWFVSLFALFVSLLWGLTGLWRSATRLFRNKEGFVLVRLGRWGVAEFTQIFVFATALFYTFSVAVFLPTYSTLFQIATDRDPLSNYVLEWGDEDKTWIYFAGTIGFGFDGELQALLNESDHVNYIQLESDGGRELEAERAARTIERAGLSTYTQVRCVSACTLLFLAGKDRTLDLEEKARIGFHGPYLSTMLGETNIGSLTEQYYQSLVRRGVSEGFAGWAIQVAPEDMWFPTPQILKEEGIVTRFYINQEDGAVPVEAVFFEEQLYGLNEAEAIFRQVDAVSREASDLQQVIDINKLALQTGWLSEINQANAHLRIGISHRFLDQYRLAVTALRQAGQIRPAFSPIIYQRALTYGDWYEDTKDDIRLRQAINDVTRLTLLEPKNAEAYSLRGYYHMLARKFDKSEADFDRSVTLAPFDSAIANNSCWFKITQLGQFDTALDDCNKALNLEPDSDAALHSRGLAHDILGNRDLAIADYRRAYEVAPEQQDISLSSIAYLEAITKEIDAANSVIGIWAPDPSLPEEKRINSCLQNALRISVDIVAGTYRAVNVTTGTELRAKLLSIEGNRFHIQYVDEDRLDEDGELVSWHLVMLDADRFFWVRDDWFIRASGRLVFQGKSSKAQIRCAPIS